MKNIEPRTFGELSISELFDSKDKDFYYADDADKEFLRLEKEIDELENTIEQGERDEDEESESEELQKQIFLFVKWLIRERIWLSENMTDNALDHAYQRFCHDTDAPKIASIFY